MTKNYKTIAKIISVILILTFLLSLCSCGIMIPSFGFIKKDSVTYYLMESDVPDFDTGLLLTVEMCFDTYYYKELEDFETLGKKTLDAYNEFCRDETDATDMDAVTYALIDCYIYAVGDNYAFYRTVDETEDYTTDMSGSFVGIGVSVSYNVLENTILIEGVELSSPAEAAGIAIGDYIVAVDGVKVPNIGVTEAINRIKGEVDTFVEVTVLRGDEEITFNIKRAEITETTVAHNIIDEKIGYIKITGFKGNTAEQFKNAVDSVEASGVEAIIFDLRSNSGGYLSAVSAMLSYLVPDGTKIASFSNGMNPLYASSGTALEEEDHTLSVPSVVLCNSRSASAAELFTAAMRDYADMNLLTSVIMGELTFKKGIMQSTIEFTDDSTLTLTTALYNPPSDINFHGVGVAPDIALDEDDDYIEEAKKVIYETLIQKNNNIGDI